MRRLALLLGLIAAFIVVWTAPAPAAPPETLTISVSRPTDVWSASGAVSDSGTFADDELIFTRTLTLHGFRTYTGSAGTFTARADVRILPTDTPGIFDVTWRWAVVAGTGAYADLHGGGTISERFDAVAGTVVGTWDGSVHFD